MIEQPSLRFRHDPRPYLRSLATVEGLALRRTLLKESAPGDWELGNRLMREVQAEQDGKGSWGQDLALTGRRMLELLSLDVVGNHPSLELAAQWVLERLEAPTGGPFPCARDHCEALLALIRMDRHYEPTVLKTVNLLSFDPEHWLPAASPEEIAVGIKLLLADPRERYSPTMPRAVGELLGRFGQERWTDAQRFLLLEVCGLAELEVAREWVAGELPFVVGQQRSEGGWADWTAAVVTALCLHGRWDGLLP